MSWYGCMEKVVRYTTMVAYATATKRIDDTIFLFHAIKAKLQEQTRTKMSHFRRTETNACY